MSQIILQNWASRKFGVQIPQNAISLIVMKRTDQEFMNDSERFAKRPIVAQNPKLEGDMPPPKVY